MTAPRPSGGSLGELLTEMPNDTSTQGTGIQLRWHLLPGAGGVPRPGGSHAGASTVPTGVAAGIFPRDSRTRAGHERSFRAASPTSCKRNGPGIEERLVRRTSGGLHRAADPLSGPVWVGYLNISRPVRSIVESAPMVEAPLRVCLLTYRGNRRSGGQGIYVRLLSRELVAMGHQVDVWSGPPYPELNPGVRLVQIPSLDLWNENALLRVPRLSELRDPINRAEWGRTLLGEFSEPRTFSQRVARRFRHLNGTAAYDVVHDNQSLGPGLLQLQSQFPVVATIHHPVTRDRQIALEAAPNLYRRYTLRRWYGFLPMQQRVSRQLDRILTVSQASAADLAREYGIHPRRLRVVSNGIHLDAFRPRPEVPRLVDRLITTLSADTPLKGFVFLLDALAALRRERSSLTLTVIGNVRPGTQTVRKIKTLGLERAVHFTGHVTVEEIARRYAESTVAVVASLYEGFGFPAGEAMACEVPVVSTRAGALPEVLGEDGSCGILVEPGSSLELTRAIRQMLDAPLERRTQIGKAGRARVEDNFTWRRAAERTVASYLEVIAERQARTDGHRTVSVTGNDHPDTGKRRRASATPARPRRWVDVPSGASTC